MINQKFTNILKDSRTNWNYILIIIIIAVIVGGGILVWQYWWPVEEGIKRLEIKLPEVVKPSTEELEAKSRSSAFIYLSETDKVKIFLYAPDEEKSFYTVEVPSCEFPEIGKTYTTYQGNYQLILDASTLTSDEPGRQTRVKAKDSVLDIGKMEFVEGYPIYGGQIEVEADSKGLKNLIIIYQYGGCVNNTAYISGYDLKKLSLVQYKFKHYDGTITDDLYGGFEPERSETGNFLSSFYSQQFGTGQTGEWQFDPENNLFQEINVWRGGIKIFSFTKLGN